MKLFIINRLNMGLSFIYYTRFLLIIIAVAIMGGCNDIVHHQKYYADGELQEMDYTGDTATNNYIGNVTIYYSTGEVKSRFRLKNAKLDGIYKDYYKSGKISTESFYVNDKLENMVKIYRENGQLAEETQYRNNKINGIQVMYSPKSKLMIFGVWKDSIPIYVLEFDTNGNVLKSFAEPYIKYPHVINLGEKFCLEITLPYIKGFNKISDFNTVIIPRNLSNDTLGNYLLYMYKIPTDDKWHYEIKKYHDNKNKYSYSGSLDSITFDSTGHGTYEFIPKDTGKYVINGVISASSAEFFSDSILTNNHLSINFTVKR